MFLSYSLYALLCYILSYTSCVKKKTGILKIKFREFEESNCQLFFYYVDIQAAEV